MNEIELLAPVGSFDALKAAVQNGANNSISFIFFSPND